MIFSHTGSFKIHLELEAGTTIPNVSCVDYNNDLTVEAWELFRSIIACGTPPIDYLPKTTFKRIREIEFKRAIMDFALSVENRYLVWDEPRISKLDSSEQSAIRYYIGMWMAWVIANKIYGIDFLCHFKRFVEETRCGFERNGKSIKTGNLSEPDFIGFKYDSTIPAGVRYCVFEAKGRKHRRQDVVDKAVKKQLPIIHEIGGRKPDDYVLAYSAGKQNFLTPTGVDINNALKVIVAKSGKVRNDAYDIVFNAGTVSPALILQRYILDLVEEVGEIKKKHYSFEDIDISGTVDGNDITLEIKYDAVRNVEVVLNRGSGRVSISEKRNLSEALVGNDVAHIVDENGNLIHHTSI